MYRDTDIKFYRSTPKRASLPQNSNFISENLWNSWCTRKIMWTWVCYMRRPMRHVCTSPPTNCDHMADWLVPSSGLLQGAEGGWPLCQAPQCFTVCIVRRLGNPKCGPAPGRNIMPPPEALLPRNPTSWESSHFLGLANNAARWPPYV